MGRTTEADAAIMIVREETRNELKELVMFCLPIKKSNDRMRPGRLCIVECRGPNVHDSVHESDGNHGQKEVEWTI